MAYALSQPGITSEEQVHRIAENFRDYWIAKSGKDAVKRDWKATWRMWVRRESDQAAARAASTARPQRRPSDNPWEIYSPTDEAYKREQWVMSHPNGQPYPGDPDTRVRDADGKLVW